MAVSSVHIHTWRRRNQVGSVKKKRDRTAKGCGDWRNVGAVAGPIASRGKPTYRSLLAGGHYYIVSEPPALTVRNHRRTWLCSPPLLAQTWNAVAAGCRIALFLSGNLPILGIRGDMTTYIAL
ncbi:hypothetical protein BHM03_00005388 [Ensete ventricosum]|nr:hypothetical protein BHM03_00005388 [Ensete ventricosum]